MAGRRRAVAVVAAALLVPLALASCGGSPAAPHPAPRTATATTAATPSADPHTADPDPRHLAAGDCFDADRTLTLIGGALPVGPVHIQPCSRSHTAEVYGRVPYPEGDRHPYPAGDDLTSLGTVGCANLVAGYDMDSWTLSPSAELTRFLLPTRAQWTAGDHDAICYWIPRDPPTTTRLRHDKSTLTADQYAYLSAVDGTESALANTPRANGQSDLPSYQNWAAGVADTLGTEAHLLNAHLWPPRAQGPVNALIQQVDALVPLWRDASQSASLAGVQRTVTALQARTTTAQERLVRGALGLATVRAR